jgi:very-short-patch-repair endonuclease
VSESKKAFAIELRRNPSRAAELLWSVLRGKRLGQKFRRRAVLYGWIPDFWCPACRVAIEIDYPSDQQRAEEHKRRDAVLAARAITVIRIPTRRIYDELRQVERELKAFLEGAKP